MVSDFALLGVNAAGAARAAGASAVGSAGADEGDFELWPEHRQAWEVFMDCSRQWRVVAGMGGIFYQGLNGPSVESSMRMLGVPRSEWRRVRGQLNTLEDEAAEILNDR